MTEEVQNIENKVCEKVSLPDEIKKFNWGAFFLTWIWGIGNKSYLTFFMFLAYGAASIFNSLGVFLPFCLGFSIYCGVMGNEWAWKNKTWEDTTQFNTMQKRWATGGAIFFVTARVLTVLFITSMIFLMFYLLNPKGDISKFQDWGAVCKKGVVYFVQYSVEGALDGTDMSKIENSNELAREIASGFDTKSLGNNVYISSNGKLVLKAYKYGDCSLEKKNCYVQLTTSQGKDVMDNLRFYIDKDKKLVPVQEPSAHKSKI